MHNQAVCPEDVIAFQRGEADGLKASSMKDAMSSYNPGPNGAGEFSQYEQGFFLSVFNKGDLWNHLDWQYYGWLNSQESQVYQPGGMFGNPCIMPGAEHMQEYATLGCKPYKA